MSDIAIKVENLSKKYHLGRKSYGTFRDTLSSIFEKNKKEEFMALRDINFEIQKGDAIGIIGKNGAGKSTILKILSKITFPTQGRVEIDGSISSLLEVGTGFHPELTGRENIFLNGALLGMSKFDIKSKFDEIVEFSGVSRFIDTPVKHYSSGMYVRLAFSVAAHLNTEILLVDEVLAVGDAEFRKKCLNKMDQITNLGKTIVFVSHNETAIRNLTNDCILLEEGRLTMFNRTDIVLNKYNHLNLSGNSTIENKNIKSIDISYNDNLIVSVKYTFDLKPTIPNLGFEIHDEKGNILFASNPLLEGITILDDYAKEGEIILEIQEPKLRAGKYSICFWFGSSLKQSTRLQKTFVFEVLGDKSNSHLGSIKPRCKYTFYG